MAEGINMSFPVLPNLEGLRILRRHPTRVEEPDDLTTEQLRLPIIIPKRNRTVEYRPEPNRPLPDRNEQWRRPVDVSFVSLNLEPAYVSCQYQTRSVNEPLNAYVKHVRNFEEFRKQHTKRMFGNAPPLSTKHNNHKLKATPEVVCKDDTLPFRKRTLFAKRKNAIKNLAPLNFSPSAKVKYGRGVYAMHRENIYTSDLVTGPKKTWFQHQSRNSFMHATLEPLRVNYAMPLKSKTR